MSMTDATIHVPPVLANAKTLPSVEMLQTRPESSSGRDYFDAEKQADFRSVLFLSGNRRLFNVGLIFILAPALMFTVVYCVFFSFRGNDSAAAHLVKAPRGPVRWNPFQSLSSMEEFDMVKGFENADRPSVTLINKDEFSEILDVLHEWGREKTKYVVIDVRSKEEIDRIGKFHNDVMNVPINSITMDRAFALDKEMFRQIFRFDKPTKDETMVFASTTGKSSQLAAEIVAMEGYVRLLNYMGGAKEWFN